VRSDRVTTNVSTLHTPNREHTISYLINE